MPRKVVLFVVLLGGIESRVHAVLTGDGSTVVRFLGIVAVTRHRKAVIVTDRLSLASSILALISYSEQDITPGRNGDHRPLAWQMDELHCGTIN